MFLQTQSPDFILGTNHLFFGLHYASHFGIEEVVAALIGMEGYDINQGDCEGLTPLIWASREGNTGLVRLLLAKDNVDPDKPDMYGQTPFWHACWSGHEEIVRMLLTQDGVNLCRIMVVLVSGFLITRDWTLAYGLERPRLPGMADVIGYSFRIGQVMW